MFPLRTFEHLVFSGVRVARQMPDVRNVHHPSDLVSGIAQIAVEDVLHDIGTQIPDVRVVVDRRTAGVHGDLTRRMGDELFFFVAERIIKLHNMPHLRVVFHTVHYAIIQGERGVVKRAWRIRKRKKKVERFPPKALVI